MSESLAGREAIPSDLIGCPECDLLFSMVSQAPGEKLSCPRCNYAIAAGVKDGFVRPLCYAISALIFLLVSLSFPFLSLTASGLHNEMTLPQAITALSTFGANAIAVLMLGFVIAIPGAMMFSQRNQVRDAHRVDIGIVAPDGRDAMFQHSDQFAERSIPFIFDPGQALPLFDGENLKEFIDQATWVTVNDYESELIKDRTGYSEQDIAQRVQAYIVTRGGEGSTIYTRDEEIDIPAAKAASLEDPTCCGDAYRAGLIYGLENNLDWPTTGRLGSLIGAIKMEKKGTQEHRFTMDEFRQRFQQEFGYVF